MKSITKATATALAVVFAAQGCSVYEAMHKPAPVEYEQVSAGGTRGHAMAVLGTPKRTEVEPGNRRIDYFEFTDGYEEAGKSRVILYIAGDVFTAGLAELIFWPVELAALKGEECRAEVQSDSAGTVEKIEVRNLAGQQLYASSRPVTDSPAADVATAAPTTAVPAGDTTSGDTTAGQCPPDRLECRW